MSVSAPIVLIFLIIAVIAYVLKRDAAVDDGAKPWSVKVPFTKYVLTPSRWAWQKVRENKPATAGFVVVCVFALWVWLK